MTKIKFGTDGWRAIIAQEYTVENVARVSKACAIWLKENFENPHVVLGHDCGFHTDLIADYLNIEGYRGTISTACSSAAKHEK